MSVHQSCGTKFLRSTPKSETGVSIPSPDLSRVSYNGSNLNLNIYSETSPRSEIRDRRSATYNFGVSSESGSSPDRFDASSNGQPSTTSVSQRSSGSTSSRQEILEDDFARLSVGHGSGVQSSGSGRHSGVSSSGSSILSSITAPPNPVRFGQPFENLFDQFDKNLSVESMLRGQQLVKQHYQSNTYARSPSQIRRPVVSGGRIVSGEHAGGKKYKRVVLDPFSEELLPPAKAEGWNDQWDKEFEDHWFF